MQILVIDHSKETLVERKLIAFGQRHSKRRLVINHQPSVPEWTLLIKNVRAADVMVIEGSQPSMLVGFCLATALHLGRPVIYFYREHLRPDIARNQTLFETERLQLVSYREHSLENEIGTAVEYALESTRLRFNFFLSPSLWGYLGWIATRRRVARSVYLRQLIMDDLRHNAQYQGCTALTK